MKKELAPVIKWVGGKRQLLPSILPLLPENYSTYCEPFIGGAALLLKLQPEKAIINDLNPNLIAMYTSIRDNVSELISLLKKHENTSEYFYMMRELDRDPEKYEAMSDVEKASRLIYLNRTCFNGLYRVNSKGQFNAPYGKYSNPRILDEENLKAISEYFNSADLTFMNGDFSDAMKDVDDQGFVYLDPPYDPISSSANFTAYNSTGFDHDAQERLKVCCDKLDRKGVRFMLSNSSTDFIRSLYSDYHIVTVKAHRNINSDGAKRGAVNEVLVMNYETCQNE